MTPHRELLLCADDFGLSAPISRGILQLAAQERLSEVSCIVTTSAWPRAASELMALPAVAEGRIRAGLHWNLTEGAPLSPALRQLWPQLPSLPRLLALAHARWLPQAALAAELDAQFAAFEHGTGCAPAFVDGHQHVHHLPVLRTLLWQRVAARPGLQVRNTGRLAGPGFAFKRQVIERSGGRSLARVLGPAQRASNEVLLGVYDFGERAYRPLMQAWLAALPPRGGMIFCHPGDAPEDGADPVAAARQRELAYLRSDEFAADLASAGVRLASERPAAVDQKSQHQHP